MEEIKRVLSALPFWPSLSEAERELLMGGAIIEDYAKKSVVCNSANACLGLSVVLAGEMRVCILSEEGREVTLCRRRAFAREPRQHCAYRPERAGTFALTARNVTQSQFFCPDLWYPKNNRTHR